MNFIRGKSHGPFQGAILAYTLKNFDTTIRNLFSRCFQTNIFELFPFSLFKKIFVKFICSVKYLNSHAYLCWKILLSAVIHGVKYTKEVLELFAAPL
jgi:hypothetical protein